MWRRNRLKGGIVDKNLNGKTAGVEASTPAIMINISVCMWFSWSSSCAWLSRMAKGKTLASYASGNAFGVVRSTRAIFSVGLPTSDDVQLKSKFIYFLPSCRPEASPLLLHLQNAVSIVGGFNYSWNVDSVRCAIDHKIFDFEICDFIYRQPGLQNLIRIQRDDG